MHPPQKDKQNSDRAILQQLPWFPTWVRGHRAARVSALVILVTKLWPVHTIPTKGRAEPVPKDILDLACGGDQVLRKRLPVRFDDRAFMRDVRGNFLDPPVIKVGTLYLNYTANFLFLSCCKGPLASVLRLKSVALKAFVEVGLSAAVQAVLHRAHLLQTFGVQSELELAQPCTKKQEVLVESPKLETLCLPRKCKLVALQSSPSAQLTSLVKLSDEAGLSGLAKKQALLSVSHKLLEQICRQNNPEEKAMAKHLKIGSHGQNMQVPDDFVPVARGLLEN